MQDKVRLVAAGIPDDRRRVLLHSGWSRFPLPRGCSLALPVQLPLGTILTNSLVSATELRSCVKILVAVLGSSRPYIIVLMVSVDVYMCAIDIKLMNEILTFLVLVLYTPRCQRTLNTNSSSSRLHGVPFTWLIGKAS